MAILINAVSTAHRMLSRLEEETSSPTTLRSSRTPVNRLPPTLFEKPQPYSYWQSKDCVVNGGRQFNQD